MNLPVRGQTLGADNLRAIDLMSHLITFSARIITTGGIVRPSAFAVLRLITSSNFVGCSTGIRRAFVPFRILSTIDANAVRLQPGRVRTTSSLRFPQRSSRGYIAGSRFFVA